MNEKMNSEATKTIWAKQALTTQGWVSGVRITVGESGCIDSIDHKAANSGDVHTGILLPSPANLHSHAFQRAMAGMTEQRGPNPRDTFWTWRDLMYRFLDHLTPDDIQSITAFAQMEMLEAGYACVAEFHYLHHQPGGRLYDDIAELSSRIIAAADETGIGLTLLPVFYERGGCDGRPLGAAQKRFGNDIAQFSKLYEAASGSITALPDDRRIGVAAHSLRAVSPKSLSDCVTLNGDAPFHIHIAEQSAEVDEVLAAYDQLPVDWLLSHHAVDENWCLVHATQMEPSETVALAKSGAVAGLCPITEANLGDGVFDGARHLENGGRFGIGSDSNIRISLSEELRLLEYSQRFKEKSRAVLATANSSTGRTLFEGAAKGGAQAAGRNSGIIETGRLADFIALDADATALLGAADDTILDHFIFAGDDRLITDVWSAGRHVVKESQHIKREAIETRYRETMKSLLPKL